MNGASRRPSMTRSNRVRFLENSDVCEHFGTPDLLRRHTSVRSGRSPPAPVIPILPPQRLPVLALTKSPRRRRHGGPESTPERGKGQEILKRNSRFINRSLRTEFGVLWRDTNGTHLLHDARLGDARAYHPVSCHQPLLSEEITKYKSFCLVVRNQLDPGALDG